MIKYEMYLSDDEWYVIEPVAFDILQSYTVMHPCAGRWRGKYLKTVVLIYICSHSNPSGRKWHDFYEKVKEILPVSHYFASKGDFVLDKNCPVVVQCISDKESSEVVDPYNLWHGIYETHNPQ
jgi:hypothetical protein